METFNWQKSILADMGTADQYSPDRARAVEQEQWQKAATVLDTSGAADIMLGLAVLVDGWDIGMVGSVDGPRITLTGPSGVRRIGINDPREQRILEEESRQILYVGVSPALPNFYDIGVIRIGVNRIGVNRQKVGDCVVEEELFSYLDSKFSLPLIEQRRLATAIKMKARVIGPDFRKLVSCL